tara:strand:+ start:37 stop:621 length:585 start_codon:yes stop_codon:yes gene_type:complete
MTLEHYYNKRESTMYRIILSVFVMFLLSTTAFAVDPIVTESTTNSTVNSKGETETTVKSPPPSAISPSINNSNSDVCTIGFSGAVQTQVLGISGGSAVRDMNCERLKLSKVLYDMGMKVAAVSNMCQDERVFSAMEMAGTPCPFMGKIGDEAKTLWDTYPELRPQHMKDNDETKAMVKGGLFGAGALGLLLLLL